MATVSAQETMGVRRSLEEIETNCTKIRELRTSRLKHSVHQTEEAWKAAKEEFRQKKVTLINKETKKRMLEQVWQDKVVIDEQQEREAAAEAAAKKAEVVELKKSNRDRRAAVRQQAEAIDAAVSQQASDVVALRALLQAVEAERAAEADARQREAILLERIAVTKRQLEEADSKMYAAQTSVEELQHKKKAIDTQVEEVRQQIRREEQDCEAVDRQLSEVRARAESSVEHRSQSTAWYEHVSYIVRYLAGISCTPIGEDALRYDLSEPAGWAVLVTFDVSSGRLREAELQLPATTAAAYASIGIAAPAISDLVSRAVELNSVEFLVREVVHRLGKPEAERQTFEAPVMPTPWQPSLPTTLIAGSRPATQASAYPGLESAPPLAVSMPPSEHGALVDSSQTPMAAARGAAAVVVEQTPAMSVVANLNKRLSMIPLRAEVEEAAASPVGVSVPPTPRPDALAPSSVAAPSPGMTPMMVVRAPKSQPVAEAATPVRAASTPMPPPGASAPALHRMDPNQPASSPVLVASTPGPSAYGTASYSLLPTSTPMPMSRESSAPPTSIAAADTIPRAEYARGAEVGGGAGACGFARSEVLARTPAGAAVPASGPPASVPLPAADTPMPSAALPPGMRTRDVDVLAVSALGSSRHQKRRQSRKSFARAVLHPRSPCERAARAGMGVDAKAALSGFVSSGSGSVTFRVLDTLGRVRAVLAADGTVSTAAGVVLAYIERDGTVGSASLEYLGEVTPAAAPNGTGYVTDAEDKLVAEVDYGHAIIKSAQGSTIAELRKDGEVRGHYGISCGAFDGFDFQMMQQAAAFIAIIDPSFVQGK